MMKKQSDPISAGERSYQEWRDRLMADPEFRAIYEEEAAQGELWLQLAETRESAGLTQEQVAKRLGVSRKRVARIEREGFSCTLSTLRRYVAALGEGFSLEVKIHTPQSQEEQSELVMPHAGQ
jgi:DNA-binding XRE family transcriptional regulator